MSINLKSPDFNAFREAGPKGKEGQLNATKAARKLIKNEGDANLREGRQLARSMAKEAAKRAIDEGIDKAGKSLAAETGGASIVAANIIKKHKKETLIILLIIQISVWLPLLFFFFILLGGGIEQTKLAMQNAASTLTIQKTGPDAVANPAGNGPEMTYHIEASGDGGTATGNASACGQKSTPPAGNDPKFVCSGGAANTASTPSSDGYYQSTNFGCNKGFQKDAADNCVPACPISTIPECKGKTGRECEEAVEWYSANAQTIWDKNSTKKDSCGEKLKVTNPKTGKAVVVRVIDVGPSCSVQSGRQKFDLSQKAAQALGGDGIVKVEKVSEATALGEVAACTAINTTAQKTIVQKQIPNASTNVLGTVAAAASLSVDIVLKPKDKDSYVINKATVSSTADGIMIVDTIPDNATFVRATGEYVTDPPAGGAATKTVTWTTTAAADTGDGATTAGGYTAPNTNTCGGKYKFTSSLKKNFGDPQCSFTKNKLFTLLKKEDPKNANTWFHKIVPCESGYNPNAYAGPQTGTPDANGAWGLYQMGSSTPAGKAPPAKGKNGVNDRGDVPWEIQTTNATTYGKKISSLGAYWACAR